MSSSLDAWEEIRRELFHKMPLFICIKELLDLYIDKYILMAERFFYEFNKRTQALNNLF